MEMAFWRRQPEEPKWPAAPAEGVSAFKKFYDAETLMEVVSLKNQKTDSYLLTSAYYQTLPFLLPILFNLTS